VLFVLVPKLPLLSVGRSIEGNVREMTELSIRLGSESRDPSSRTQ